MFRSPDSGGSIPQHLLAAAMGSGAGGGREEPKRFLVTQRTGFRLPVVRVRQPDSPTPPETTSPVPPEASPSPAPEHPNTQRLRTIFPTITQDGVAVITKINEVLASEPGMGGLQIGEPLPQPTEPLENGKQPIPAVLKWIGTSDEVAGEYPVELLGDHPKPHPPKIIKNAQVEGEDPIVRILKNELQEALRDRRAAMRPYWDGSPLAIPDGDTVTRKRGKLLDELKALAPDTRDELNGPTYMAGGTTHVLTEAAWPVPKEKWPQEDREAQDNYRENRKDK